jgi:hypothetical protein
MDKVQYFYIGQASLKAERSDVRKKTGKKVSHSITSSLVYDFH